MFPASTKTHYDSCSSESSFSEYSSEDRFHSQPSVRIRTNVSHTSSTSRRRPSSRPPQAPVAPAEPRSPFEALSSVPPSLDSSSDTPSSHSSSHPYDYSTLSPISDVTPEIVDGASYGHNSYYTGAYGRYARDAYGAQPPRALHPSHHATYNPPKRVPISAERRPNIVFAEPAPAPAPASATAPPPVPPIRGGPMAGSYLAANAPPPPPPPQEPVEIEVKDAIPTFPPARDAYGQSRQIAIPNVRPVIPIKYAPVDYSESSDEYDDEPEGPLVYIRARNRGRPRNTIRHVAINPADAPPPPRSHSRPRSRSRPRAQHHGHHHHRHNHHHRGHHHSHKKAREEEEKRNAELQAQIDALTTRLADVVDNPYARDVIAEANIKFDTIIEEKKK